MSAHNDDRRGVVRPRPPLRRPYTRSQQDGWSESMMDMLWRHPRIQERFIGPNRRPRNQLVIEDSESSPDSSPPASPSPPTPSDMTPSDMSPAASAGAPSPPASQDPAADFDDFDGWSDDDDAAPSPPSPPSSSSPPSAPPSPPLEQRGQINEDLFLSCFQQDHIFSFQGGQWVFNFGQFEHLISLPTGVRPSTFTRFYRMLCNASPAAGRVHLQPTSLGPPNLLIPWTFAKYVKSSIFLYVLTIFDYYRRTSNVAATPEYNVLFSFNIDLIHQGTYPAEYARDQASNTTRVSGIRVNLARPVTFDEIMRVYNEIVGFFLDDAHLGAHWADSDEIYIVDTNLPRSVIGHDIIFSLRFRGRVAAPLSTRLTSEMRGYISKSFRSGIKAVENEDCFCLLYTILLGLMWRENRHAVGINGKFISRGRMIVLCQSQFSARIRDLCEKIQRGELECMWKIEESALQSFSLGDFSRFMEEVEKEVLPEDEIALDVFIQARNGPVFPGYRSKKMIPMENRIEVLSLNVSERSSHFVLVTNGARCWPVVGGKQFFTCTKCGQTFYLRSMLLKHQDGGVCHERPNEYHWSAKCDAGCDPAEEVASCQKCRLSFTSEFCAQYHARNCFMQGRSGYRQVKLSKDDWLRGVPPSEDEALPTRKIYFADFECTIDKNGEHHFMSYGVTPADDPLAFEIGYDISKFLDPLFAEAEQSDTAVKVYFHNAMNYDANFILRYFLNEPKYKEWTIKAIFESANRMKKLAFVKQVGRTKKVLEIGDTFKFLTMSLARICESVKKPTTEENEHMFPRFFRYFMNEHLMSTKDEVNQILQKNLFPYLFFDAPEKLETPIDRFRELFLPDEKNLQYFGDSVTVEDLAANLPLFEKVCNDFMVDTARDYHDIYLACDVFQIADVFMAARESLWQTHHVDLANYMGMPSASWAAFLRYDQSLKIPLYESTFFAEFFQRMTRGGVTSAPLRYAKSDETHSILYLDVNGLYPYVMQKYPYPCGSFKLRFPSEYQSEHPEQTVRFLIHGYETMKTGAHPGVVRHGACFCVDLHVPLHIRDKIDQFPFAPDHQVIKDQYYDSEGQMYPFLQRWSEVNGGEQMKAFRGLVATLDDKEEYGVHWKLLKWYLDHGMEVTKLHHWVEFEEDYYLKGYVSHNIELRNQRKDPLGKMVYKLMGNSIYGKTFESPFNRDKFVIVRDPVKLDMLIQDAPVSQFTPIDENNYVVKLTGDEVVLDKPTYIGACVTEYAKLHMYKVFYDYLAPLFSKIELVYTDTDSFIIRVEHDASLKGQDLLDYINGGPHGVLIGGLGGQLKSETGTDFIEEVIALRSKVYAYRTLSGHVDKRAKGTTAAAQEKELDWEAYKQTLVSLRALPTTNTQFVRRQMGITTVELLKKSLTANDGKRYICEDGIHTHAFGYF